MNVVLQRHGARHIYVVPEGLKELTSDISREVLRSQPEHLYAFMADYCDALLITRENARIAASLVASLTDCSLTIIELLERTGMSQEEANKKAVVIQNAFRKYMSRHQYPLQTDPATESFMFNQLLVELNLPRYQAVAAANVIKTAFKTYKERQKIFEDDIEFINWRKALQNSLFIYRKTGVPNDVINRAVSAIKAAYRGYYTRRYILGVKCRSEIGLQVAERGVGDFPPEVQRTFDRLKIDPYSDKVLNAVIFLQYVIRKYLFRTSSKRIVRDVVKSLSRLVVPSDQSCRMEQVSPDSSCKWRDVIRYGEPTTKVTKVPRSNSTENELTGKISVIKSSAAVESEEIFESESTDLQPMSELEFDENENEEEENN